MDRGQDWFDIRREALKVVESVRKSHGKRLFVSLVLNGEALDPILIQHVGFGRARKHQFDVADRFLTAVINFAILRIKSESAAPELLD